MPIAAGKERLQVNVTQGFRARLTALRRRLVSAFGERLGPAVADDGALMDWLVARADEWATWRDQAAADARAAEEVRLAAEQEAGRIRAEAEEMRREAASALGRAEADAAGMVLSPQARDLLNRAVEHGLRAETFVSILEVFVGADAAMPERVAAGLRELGGLDAARAEWSRRVAALEQSVLTLRDAEARAKQAAVAAMADAEDTAREAADFAQRVAAVRKGIDDMEVAGALLDLRLGWLADQMRRLTDYPSHGTGALSQVARLQLAGLLLVPMPGEPDVVLPLRPGPGHPMPLKMPVSDIMAALAPARALRDQEDLWISRTMQAETEIEGADGRSAEGAAQLPAAYAVAGAPRRGPATGG